MKNLLISGQTMMEWDVNEVLFKDNSPKRELEKVEYNNHFQRIKVKELYMTEYLNLEYNKSI